MRIAIMGAGSLGTILGAYVSKAGYDVVLIDPYQEHVDALNKDGAHVIGTVDFVQPVKAITPDQMDGVYDVVIYMAKQIKDVLTMEPLGVLRASIKISYLKKMTLTAQESLSAHIFLLDQDNNILLESAGENMDLKDQKWVDQINGNSGNLWLNLDGKAYSLVYQTSSETGLTVVGMIPTSFLQKTARELEKPL